MTLIYRTECPHCLNTAKHTVKPAGLIVCKLCNRKYDGKQNKKEDRNTSSSSDSDSDSGESLSTSFHHVSVSKKGKPKTTATTDRTHLNRRNMKKNGTTKAFKRQSSDIESDSDVSLFEVERELTEEEEEYEDSQEEESAQAEQGVETNSKKRTRESSFFSDEDEDPFLKKLVKQRNEKNRMPEHKLNVPRKELEMSDFDEDAVDEYIESKKAAAEAKAAARAKAAAKELNRRKRLDEDLLSSDDEELGKDLFKNDIFSDEESLKQGQAEERDESEKSEEEKEEQNPVVKKQRKMTEAEEFKGIRWSGSAKSYMRGKYRIYDKDLIDRYRAYVDRIYNNQNFDIVKTEEAQIKKKFRKPATEYKKGPYRAHTKASNKYNPFIMYNQRQRPIIKAENPDLPHEQAAELIGKMWREMDPEAKEKWNRYCLAKRMKFKDLVQQQLAPDVKIPPSAYILFQREEGSKYKGQWGKGQPFETYSKFMAHKWRNLSPDEKNVYQKRSHTMKANFKKQYPDVYKAKLVKMIERQTLTRESKSSKRQQVKEEE